MTSQQHSRQQWFRQWPSRRVFSSKPYNHKNNRNNRRSGQMAMLSNLLGPFNLFKMFKQMN